MKSFLLIVLIAKKQKMLFIKSLGLCVEKKEILNKICRDCK
jgi:hypothetical protein